ncbi:MAG: DUF2125 domain-containing protein [Alphaproteobacteria bacterium]|nr:DUF2125 domain-containing protein [Alphaproteobacteria bacterium]
MKFFDNIRAFYQKIGLPQKDVQNRFMMFLVKWRLSFLFGVVSFVVCLCFITAYFYRTYAIGTLKIQFEELEKNLQSIGYDFAYDDLRFYSFSPWQIMRAKNFRIYSLDEKNFFQWNAEEFNIDVGLWNIQKVGIYLGRNHTLQIGSQEWPVHFDESNIKMRLKKGKFKELLMSFKGITVKNLAFVDSLQTQIKHQHSPFAFTKTDLKGLTIDDATGWPLNKKVDHFYLYSSLQGSWDSDVSASDAFYEWIDKGGYVQVNKMILNWKPLIMVANGDIHFDENANSTISLNTASLAMLETIDKLDENNFISKKGAFVVKLLLNNKAIQQNPADQYKTVVTPLKISKDAVLLENIKLR